MQIMHIDLLGTNTLPESGQELMVDVIQQSDIYPCALMNCDTMKYPIPK